ncbi:MAG: glycosyltransferase [Phycisphaerales bacterium]|nr:glycosyltransferase [Phycisphaerales bacterium]
MRLAYSITAFPTISETFILDQITAMIDRGHDVTIFADARDDGRHGNEPVHDDVDRYQLGRFVRRRPHLPWSRLPRFLGLSVMAGRQFLRHPGMVVSSLNPFAFGVDGLNGELLRHAVPWFEAPGTERDFDVIHAHHGPNGRLAVMLRRLGVTGAPIITSFHGSDINVFPQRRGVDIYDELLTHGDRFTVNSSYTRERLEALGPLDARTEILPVGVRPETFAFTPPSQRAPLTNGAPLHVLSVGRLVSIKGFEYGIRAIAQLRDAGVPVRYEIIGAGPEHDALRALVTELHLEEHIALLGARTSDELREHYGRAHVLLAPGIVRPDGAAEAQGLVLLEAQAAGMIVIASDAGGMPACIDTERAGMCVTPGDPAAIAAAILRLLDEPHTWDARAEAGRTFVERHFNQHTLLDRLESIYVELAGHAGRTERTTHA